MRPRLPEVLRTPSGKIELAPEDVLADVPRLEADLRAGAGQMVLIGRRQHAPTTPGCTTCRRWSRRDRCTIQIRPDDAARLGLGEDANARVSSSVGELVA